MEIIFTLCSLKAEFIPPPFFCTKNTKSLTQHSEELGLETGLKRLSACASLKRKGQERAGIYWRLSCICDFSEMSTSHLLKEGYLPVLN